MNSGVRMPIFAPRFAWRALLWCCLLCGAWDAPVHAQGSLTLTVTPPLFQLNLSPGETWTSGIQVVNSNPYDITVYAEPVPFRPSGEDGRPAFFTPPKGKGGVLPDASTLAGWITVPTDAVPISREQTTVVPIAITVPHDAPPGGQYAAVLIGNRASEEVREGDTVSVTSSIASLIFLRVAGTVIEKGRVRDFATERSYYETADARFSLRFENQGNVHLRPHGDITIYNMFGKKRGYIPVNQVEEYGNVLPESVRRFTFTWKGDAGAWDIGRYRAEATIGYGADATQYAQAATYFYVLPLAPLTQVFGAIVACALLVGWAVRAYVRRALILEAARLSSSAVTTPAAPEEKVPESRLIKVGTLIRPIQAGIIDLRNVYAPVSDPVRAEQVRAPLGIIGFLRRYRIFFGIMAAFVIMFLFVRAYVTDVFVRERGYTVTEERPDGTRTLIERP